ncbi:MAG: hypothetical protein IKU54_06900 [Oscillospiraceae bacterium]|nr:hypothetical protein [Oscillospiraceae bacterium]
MMKEVHAERGSALVMAGLVIISMIGTMIFKDSGEKETANNNTILFPAYYTENPDKLQQIDDINGSMPFNCKVDWPENWTLTENPGDAEWPQGELYTPMYIYDGDTPIGYIAFNVFEPVAGDVTDPEYHKTVWTPLLQDKNGKWEPFTSVLTGFTSQIGIVDIDYSVQDGQTVSTNGILAYDTGLKAYVGIAFMPGAVTREQAIELAMTVRLYAV